ncbi:MAG: type II secretion system F family protein [Planctomycetia bacterium]|nr:type II secretion system F family protein [Planctomycetia bacterium]
MPTYQFEAWDAKGAPIKDVIEAPSEDEAQQTIRQMGYFVTKISVKKAKRIGGPGKRRQKSLSIGKASNRQLTTFTRQLSILQDAGLPILRSLRILETQTRPGPLKNALIDVVDDIEGGASLSEAMAKCPKAFDRLYVNMVKAGEAGGALEIILQRLAEFLEKAQTLRRKVKGALVYPIVVLFVAAGILTFIMVWIVPAFEKIFKEFGSQLPAITQALIGISNAFVYYWWALILAPVALVLLIKLMGMFAYGRMGWDLFKLKMPVFGQLVEKNIIARTTRTLGTLVASGVPILEALNITRETSANAMFEKMYLGVYESIREGESIAVPMRQHSKPRFNVVALWWWMFFIGGLIGILMYLMKSSQRIVDELVVNMVDVGEETGELDTMLYKIADNYDEEVKVLTDALTSMLEPVLIVVLGGIVGFIVVALFMPLIQIIVDLTGGGNK